MFLKMQGVTGESADADHKDEIDVVSWSWGMQASASIGVGGAGGGRDTMTDLEIVKRVDKSSTALMSFLRNHKLIKQAKLTVRKAGKTPVEYFAIELENVRIRSLRAESQGMELLERVNLAFQVVTVTYTLQDPTGTRGAASSFTADAQAGT